MRFINKAGLVAGALTTLLILASCSDSDTSTGVTTGKQLANDSSTEVVMHQGTAGTGEHSNPDTNHGHSPDQQHAEPNNPTTSSVVALLSISNPTCGNLIQEDGEQCDGGLGGNTTCNADCTLKTLHGEVIATTACGNGIVDPGEQCDDANDSNEDDCTRFCKTPVCGDGYVQGSNGEQCDDKNRIDTDGCNNACQSSTTTVVTTTTVIEQVNDDGGTTQVATTTPAATPEGTTQEAATPPVVVLDETPPTNTCGGGREEANNPTPCAPEVVEEPIIPPVEADAADGGGSFSQDAPATAGGVNYCYQAGEGLIEGEVSGDANCQAAVNEYVVEQNSIGSERHNYDLLRLIGDGQYYAGWCDYGPADACAGDRCCLNAEVDEESDPCVELMKAFEQAQATYENALSECDGAGDKESKVCDEEKKVYDEEGGARPQCDTTTDLINNCRGSVKKQWLAEDNDYVPQCAGLGP